MILPRKWWSTWIWFRVGRKYQNERKKKKNRKKICIYISVGNRSRNANETANRILTIVYIYIYFHFACTTPNLFDCACAFEWIRTTANLWTIYCNSTLAHTCRPYHQDLVYTFAVLYIVCSPFRTHTTHSLCLCIEFKFLLLLPFFECALALSYYIVSVIGCALAAYSIFIQICMKCEAYG